MFHQDFRQIAVDAAFEAIEGSVLPSLTRMIDTAASADPGIDAEAKAAELRELARQLSSLTAMVEATMPRAYAAPSSTEA
ncbi:MAG: hypothetical protein JWL74_569 [Alphaproteobacteria bacterium]|jgi:hypothetical protein|nr:hypothetical protein [Alphaproteobacteria bacterium]